MVLVLPKRVRPEGLATFACCKCPSLLEDLLPIWRKPMPIIEEQPDLHFPLTLKRRGQGEQDCEEEEEKVFYQTPDG